MLGRKEAALAARPPATRLLRALAGNSPYLADLAVREHASLGLLIERGPRIVVVKALTRLRRATPRQPRERIAAALREAKRQVALATAVADIGGLWRLERVSAALSDLAEVALVLATRHLLLAAHEAKRIRLPDPREPDHASGFVVLGMGKLGARELNYSSDIDLVLLYDPTVLAAGEAAPGAVYARLARELVALMQERDADGYVFRTDLRLRPDPAATAPAVALPAALIYYESMAQNWERAAMVKARPVAGDRALGEGFLEAIRPFVWRRYLDFAAIADIHAMRRRIDTRVAGSRLPARGATDHPLATLTGYNLKLGAGGIRAIEFLTQTLQLVWGGRNPALRLAATLPALTALAASGVLVPRAAKELAVAYRMLRTVEHRLQMVADRQTHSLPATAEDLARFLLFLGRADGPDPGRLARQLLRHLKRVEVRYHEMLEPAGEIGTLPSALDLRGVKQPGQAARDALADLGFANLDGALAVLAGWQTGRLRALRTERARELLLQLLPQILGALARQRDPDAALARFDAFLARLPAGVQILSLFEHHPALLGRTAAVLGAAPSLAEHLAGNPAHLDGLLANEEADPDPEHSLAARLAELPNFEPAIEEMRAFVQAEAFRISVATLDGRLDVDEAGIVRTRLAEAALSLLLPRVLSDFACRFGPLPSGRMAVVALGKAGGREMMAGSDLDLMLIYDHSLEIMESRGSRPLAASEWFIRAAHAFVAALSSPGAEGPIYAVDMRLRPSGNKGPVAVSLAAFRRYHAADAWTWERMALTRARVIAGPAGFRGEVETAIQAALAAGGSAERIRADAAAMRSRIARELRPSGPWDVRLRRGGSLEVDFIAQALQLIHGPRQPSLWSTSTREALARLESIGLLGGDEASVLIRADYLFRTVQGMLRVALGGPPADALPESAAAALLDAVRAGGGDVADTTALEAYLERTTGSVRGLFERILGVVEEKAQ
ncbi:MAG: bifunctional [glutamine synthetase] adenylyltransferase/[glutamine synthetase]-adenylyl-L-tyrosine phosphorylase [Acetobacteraceae bacterium]